ncbi:MAG: YqaA family protein [Halobacteriota archaeon]
MLDYLLLELFVVNLTAPFHPFPAEPTIAILLDKQVDPLIVSAIVISGSFLGAVVGYVIGKHGIRRFIPDADRERMQQAQQWFGKYGGVMLLASPWIPFAGDLVSIVAGIERYAVDRFLVFMLAAKVIKGVALVYFISFFLQYAGLHF